MKRVISILLAAAMLMTLTCISAFAASAVTIAFDCPSAGDKIPDHLSIANVNSGSAEAILYCRIAGEEAIDAFLSSNPQDTNALSGYEVAHPFSDTTYRQNVPYLFVYYIPDISPGDIAAGSNVNAAQLFDDNFGIAVCLSFTPIGDNTDNGSEGGGTIVPDTGAGDIVGNTPNNGNNSTITSQNGTTEIPITASYDTTLVEQKVYRVDIVWGSMAFTYHPEFIGNWNPNTHTYSDEAEAYWSFEEHANRIIVTNHSNAPISATFSYAALSSYNTITGAFSVADQTLLTGSQTIASASGTTLHDAPFLAAYLMLSGELNKETANNTPIGTVTVTIS